MTAKQDLTLTTANRHSHVKGGKFTGMFTYGKHNKTKQTNKQKTYSQSMTVKRRIHLSQGWENKTLIQNHPKIINKQD